MIYLLAMFQIQYMKKVLLPGDLTFGYVSDSVHEEGFAAR